MLLPCGPRIVVGLLVELVGDPLLSPYRRSHESSRVPSSADGGWRGPFAGSQARLPTLDRRQLRSQSRPPSVFLAKPRVSPVNHPFAPDLLSPRPRCPIRLIAPRPRNERKGVFPCPWVVLAAAVPVLRHSLVLSVMGALGIVSQDLAEPRERIRCVGLSKDMTLFCFCSVTAQQCRVPQNRITDMCARVGAFQLLTMICEFLQIHVHTTTAGSGPEDPEQWGTEERFPEQKIVKEADAAQTSFWNASPKQVKQRAHTLRHHLLLERLADAGCLSSEVA